MTLKMFLTLTLVFVLIGATTTLLFGGSYYGCGAYGGDRDDENYATRPVYVCSGVTCLYNSDCVDCGYGGQCGGYVDGNFMCTSACYVTSCNNGTCWTGDWAWPSQNDCAIGMPGYIDDCSTFFYQTCPCDGLTCYQ